MRARALVEKCGPGVTRVKEGDHVVSPSSRSAGVAAGAPPATRASATRGASILDGCLPDGTFRFHEDGPDVGAMCMLGTFSQYSTVSEMSCVAVDKDLPLEKVALVGCGVPTGWCSAVYAADVEPGETVIIYGIGGVGANAVQGAAHAGAAYVIAVDPLENKREAAGDLGATHTAASAEEAHEIAQELTRGVGADKAIITVDIVNATVVGAGRRGNPQGRHRGHHRPGRPDGGHRPALRRGPDPLRKDREGHAVRKAATRCTTSATSPALVYQAGKLKLDELITETGTPSTTSTRASPTCSKGRNIRGVVIHEH